MSFSGKRFRRTGGSNLDDFLKASNASEHVRRLLETNAPIWSFTKIDHETMSFSVQMDDINVNKTFKLGQEHELERKDGMKVKMTLTMEGDNVLKQKIVQPDGKIAYFRREFGERTATMTITMEGADVRKAHIFYEIIE